jgi:hypothetical protein
VGGVAWHQYLTDKILNKELAGKVGSVQINNHNIFHTHAPFSGTAGADSEGTASGRPWRSTCRSSSRAATDPSSESGRTPSRATTTEAHS